MTPVVAAILKVTLAASDESLTPTTAVAGQLAERSRGSRMVGLPVMLLSTIEPTMIPESQSQLYLSRTPMGTGSQR